MYEVVIENRSEKGTAISAATLFISEAIPPGGCTTFQLPTEDALNHLIPQLVQLDAKDDITVLVKELR